MKKLILFALSVSAALALQVTATTPNSYTDYTVNITMAAPAAKKTPTVDQKWLDNTAAYWQHILKLDDWRVIVRTASASELKGAWGKSFPQARSKTVFMQVLNPVAYAEKELETDSPAKSADEIVADIEDTILHELVHLRVRELGDLASGETDEEQSLESDVEELLVNRLTSALLAAHGSGK